MSIHQPRFAIFRMFDRLTLLDAGSTIYHGKASEALDFFKSLGILSLLLGCFSTTESAFVLHL